MTKDRFTTFQNVSRLSNKRDIVLFGAGNIANKTLRKLVSTPVVIIDNNPNLWGTSQYGLDVKSADVLKDMDKAKIFIIICTTSFDEVTEQLVSMGFKSGVDFVVSPIINDLRIISELESLETRLLFSSGAPTQESASSGGGIYELEVDGQWKHKKVFKGTTHGIIKFGENFVATHHELGIIEIDPKYKLVRNSELPSGSRCHGVAYSELKQQFYIASSYLDAVLVLDKDFKHIDTISISHKCKIEGEPCHHCNDICVVGNSLYISMFSYSGNWKRNVFDGVVLEIDLNTNELYRPVITGLWMPHNIDFIAGSLTVLDSLRGQLKRDDAQAVGEFPGFSRGLGYDGVYYYVGQSRNRNYSSYLGLSRNISIDTSIIVFDEHTKVSKSLFLPSKLSEIHSILVL